LPNEDVEPGDLAYNVIGGEWTKIPDAVLIVTVKLNGMAKEMFRVPPVTDRPLP
jgi:hypothetical protein